jgi:hypothetical protein
MNPQLTFGLCLGLTAVPVAALAFTAQNGNRVNPMANGVFEVVQNVRSRPADFWCGAGDFAVRALRAASAQRVYVWRPIGASETQPSSNGVQFALNPPPGADTNTGYSLSVKRAGDNLTAGAAQQYCFGNRFSDF